MSASVNLLPPELEERARARRTTSWTITAVLFWVVLLGVLYLVKLGDLNDARDDRDEARAEVARLQTEVDRLQEYAELDRVVTARNALLTDVMSTEISWARVLNDLALTFPPSSSLLTFSGATQAAGETTGAAAPAPGGESVASASFDGYSVERYAPGVERVLVKFGDVSAFFRPYVAQANNEERSDAEVTRFNGTFQLNDEAYTGRYANGLPAEAGR